jgi:hypothetical protein
VHVNLVILARMRQIAEQARATPVEAVIKRP